MSEARATQFHEELDGQPGPEPLGLAPDPVEVRRNAGLAALVGAIASAVGIAYLARATSTGAVLDWALVAVMGVLAVANLRSFVDARTPLLVADTQGVRIRLGRTWRGMPWGALARVEHRPRRGVLHDGRLVLVARNPERVVAELDPSGRRQTKVAEKLYGAPFAVPIALSTRVVGAGDDLTVALARLAGDDSLVVEVVPEEPEVEEAAVDLADGEEGAREGHEGDDGDEFRWDVQDVPPTAPVEYDDHDGHADDTDDDGEADAGDPARDELGGLDELDDEEVGDDEVRAGRWHDPRPALALGIGALSARLARRRGRADEAAEVVEDDEAQAWEDEAGQDEAGQDETRPERTPEPETSPMVASATPSPLRDPVGAARAEVRHQLHGAAALAPDHDEDSPRRDLPESRELRRPGSVNLVEDTMVWGDRVRPISRAGSSVEPIVIDEYAVEPAEDPVIGPELAAARTRLGLSVDQLADRTRIRPHVIESIEVDDFAPCGGDFYARGHLRTLARADRGRDGRRPGLVDRQAGAGRPGPQRRLADPERLAGHRQPLPARRRPGAGAAHRRGRGHPRAGARRLRGQGVRGRPGLRREQDAARRRHPRPGPGLRRLPPGQPRRQGPRHRGQRGRTRQEHLRLPLTGQLWALCEC